MTYIAIGSHLKVKRLGYSHHGIYIGAGQVIHYAGLCESLRAAPVRIDTLEVFMGSATTIDVIDHGCHALYQGREAVARARSRLDEDDYHLLFNNCEHFCYWCITGVSKSPQVRKAVACVVSMPVLHRYGESSLSRLVGSLPSSVRSRASLLTKLM